MNKDSYYENWKEKNIKTITEIIDFIPKKQQHFIINFINNAYLEGYCDGLETQETKTSEYKWNKWNQK